MAQHWDCFQVESFSCDKDINASGLVVGQDYNFNLVIDRHELQGMLGAEMVIAKEDPEKHDLRFVKSYQFELKKTEGSKLFFELKLTPSEAGNHKVSFRVFPQHKELPHRMDFAYVRWIQL